MLKDTLLEILACPKCKGELAYKIDENNDRNGTLTCHQCQLIYSVENDIPKMLIDDAKKIPQPEDGQGN